MIRKFFQLELDLRALACLRIALGFLVLLDLILRTRDLQTFYTDSGVLPRLTLLQIPHPSYLSFFMSAGESIGVAFGFFILGLSALGLLLGWNTRSCSVMVWVLHIALKHRNPLILDAGDLELGLILWWAMFLPLGARYSLDALGNPEWRNLPNNYASLATTGYVLQISLVYTMALLNKTDPVWLESGLALYYCLSYDQFVTNFGQFLVQHLQVTRGLTFAVLVVEGAIPLLLWSPWKRKSARALACLLLIGFHLGVASTLHLGLMVPINILVTVGLWPGFLFNKLGWPIQLKLPAGPQREQAPAYRLPKATRVLLLLTCLYIVHLNYAVYNNIIVPKPIKFFGYLTRQQQEWKLFAPHPGTGDGWFIAQAETLTGQKIDLLREGQSVDFEKPKSVASLFPNQRWRMWLFNLGNRRDPLVNEAFATWLARDWNERHPGPASVKHITMIFLAEPTPLPGQALRTSPVTLFEFVCPESLYKKTNEVFLPLTPP